MTLSDRLARAPWNDRRGRFSALKAAMLVLAVVPGAWLAWKAMRGELSLLPLAPVTYHTGVFAVWFLLLTLAITPARRLFGPGRLILVRRLAGLTAFAYALAHLVAYGLLRELDWPTMGREVVTRASIAVAVAAILGLSALAATSTDAAIRRLGPGWSRLHRLVYPAAGLAVLHYVLSPSSVAGQPYLMAGLFFWLMGWRGLNALGRGDRVTALAGLSLACALVTAMFEAAAVSLFHGYPAAETLALNFSLDLGLSPGWTTLLAGLGVTLARAVRDRRR